MDLNDSPYISLKQLVKDVDSIITELVSIVTKKEKTEEDRKMMETLPRLFVKKEREFLQLSKSYQERCKTKLYIEELKKVAQVQDRKLQLLSDGFGKMYNTLGELQYRVNTQMGFDMPEAPLEEEDIVRTAGLYSRSHSVMAPDKNPGKFRPYPLAEELRKGRLAQLTAKRNRFKMQNFQDSGYILSMNQNQAPQDLKEKLKMYPALLASPSSSTVYMEKYKQQLEKEAKSEKLWTHYRPAYEPIKVGPWSEKAFNPQGIIEFAEKSTKKNDGRGDYNFMADGDLSRRRQAPSPPYPQINLVPMQEKHSIFYRALTGNNEEEDLFLLEDRLNPLSVQSCDMVEAEAPENVEKYQQIAEHSKQKYSNSFQDEHHPWLQIPGQEKLKKKAGHRFRLTSPAYFGEQQRASKKIVWNAKYGRFYRNHKFRVPRLSARSFTFPNPHRQNDAPAQFNKFEVTWNIRKWNLAATVMTPIP